MQAVYQLGRGGQGHGALVGSSRGHTGGRGFLNRAYCYQREKQLDPRASEHMEITQGHPARQGKSQEKTQESNALDTTPLPEVLKEPRSPGVQLFLNPLDTTPLPEQLTKPRSPGCW